MTPQELFGSRKFCARHYVLKSPTNDVEQYYVVPVRRRIGGLRERHGEAFALAMWRARAIDLRHAYVIPFAMIARGFLVAPNRPRDDGWDASIRNGILFIAGNETANVAHCRGDQPSVLELLLASSEDAICRILAHLAGNG